MTEALASKSKTVATWLAMIGGPLGLHRFYLYGLGDVLGWLYPIPTLVGMWGMQRVSDYGQDDQLAWILVPVLGFVVASNMLQAIVYGLTPDERWNARYNPGLVGSPNAPVGGWAAVIGVGLALALGATVLMATIAFSGQRYFEYQVEESRKLSQ